MVKTGKSFLCGFLSCILFVGCAGFSYRYYGLSEVDFQSGNLLGPTGKDDLPFSKCAPNAESKFPCVVMFTKDFYAFRMDYEDTKQKLKACEKNRQ